MKKITDNEVDQNACLVAITHKYQEHNREVRNIRDDGAWIGVQDIPLEIENADTFDFAPVIVKLKDEAMIFFSVYSIQEYTKQLQAEQEEELEQQASKKQKSICFDALDEED